MIHALVPAFNEELNIPLLIEDLRGALSGLDRPARLLVVDDGSSDGTVARAEAETRPELPVEVLRQPRNLGPGAAFSAGFARILETAADEDVLLTLEADRTSDLAILPRMLRRLEEEGDDIVLASCYLYGGGIRGTQVHRVGLSHIANALMKVSLGLSGLATLSSFYRLYRVSALRGLVQKHGPGFVTARGFECQVEILHRAAGADLRISEVPMVLDGSRRVGASKMKVWKTSLAYLRLAGQAWLGRL